VERLDKSAAEFWLILNKRAEKGPNFKKDSFPPLILSNSRKSKKYYYFPLTQTKIVFFSSPNSSKSENYGGGTKFFSSKAEFFPFRTRRKVLQKVGNTDIHLKVQPLVE
jgi:hypothetical protein